MSRTRAHLDRACMPKARLPLLAWKRHLPHLGWGLITAWGLVGMSASAGGATAESPARLGVFTGSAGILCLLAVAVLAIHRDRAGTRACSVNPLLPPMERRCALVGGLVMGICCLSAQIARVDYPSFEFQTAMHAVASVGYMVLAVGWVRSYRRLDVQDVETCSVLSTALCALVYLVALLVPPLVASLLWVLLPVGSAAMLYGSAQGDGATEPTPNAAGDAAPDRTAYQPPVPAALRGPLAKRGIACFFGVLVGSVALVAPAALAVKTGATVTPFAPYAQLSGLALSTALVLYCTVYARRISLSQFFKILYPLGVCGLCLIAMTDRSAVAQFVGLCLLYAAQWVLYLFIWLYALESCTAERHVLAYVFLRVGFELGFLVSNAMLADGFGDSLTSLRDLCFVAAAAFVLTILLPLDEQPADEHPSPDTALSSPDCHALAERYALSPRECEVLSYLRRGYSLVAIRNELYISKGTVDTYVQRIYRKFGVHSRQELVNLCEKAEGSQLAAPSASDSR